MRDADGGSAAQPRHREQHRQVWLPRATALITAFVLSAGVLFGSASTPR